MPPGAAARRDRAARGGRPRPRPARDADGRGANAAPHGGGGRLQPGRRRAPALHEGAAEGEARREHPRGRGVLADTGIRVLRERAGLHDAERLPAGGLRARGRRDERRAARRVEEQHCYVCKQHYRELHHFYDQLCPPCAAFNFAKRTETRRSARPRRAAHRRPREDRLPGRDQAAARRRAADRDDALPARRRRALRAGARLRRLGRPAGDLRPRSAPHAERRGVLPPPARRRATGSTSSSTTPARRCGARRSSTRT